MWKIKKSKKKEHYTQKISLHLVIVWVLLFMYSSISVAEENITSNQNDKVTVETSEDSVEHIDESETLKNKLPKSKKSDRTEIGKEIFTAVELNVSGKKIKPDNAYGISNKLLNGVTMKLTLSFGDVDIKKNDTFQTQLPTIFVLEGLDGVTADRNLTYKVDPTTGLLTVTFLNDITHGDILKEAVLTFTTSFRNLGMTEKTKQLIKFDMVRPVSYLFLITNEIKDELYKNIRLDAQGKPTNFEPVKIEIGINYNNSGVASLFLKDGIKLNLGNKVFRNGDLGRKINLKTIKINAYDTTVGGSRIGPGIELNYGTDYEIIEQQGKVEDRIIFSDEAKDKGIDHQTLDICYDYTYNFDDFVPPGDNQVDLGASGMIYQSYKTDVSGTEIGNFFRNLGLAYSGYDINIFTFKNYEYLISDSQYSDGVSVYGSNKYANKFSTANIEKIRLLANINKPLVNGQKFTIDQTVKFVESMNSNGGVNYTENQIVKSSVLTDYIQTYDVNLNSYSSHEYIKTNESTNWKVSSENDELILTYVGPTSATWKAAEFYVRFDWPKDNDLWKNDISSNWIETKVEKKNSGITRSMSTNQKISKHMSVPGIEGTSISLNRVVTLELNVNKDYQAMKDLVLSLEKIEGLKNIKVKKSVVAPPGQKLMIPYGGLTDTEIFTDYTTQLLENGDFLIKPTEQLTKALFITVTGELDPTTISDLENPKIKFNFVEKGVRNDSGQEVTFKESYEKEVPRYLFTNEPLIKNIRNNVLTLALNPGNVDNNSTKLEINFQDVGVKQTIPSNVTAKKITSIASDTNWQTGESITVPSYTFKDQILTIDTKGITGPIELAIPLAMNNPFSGLSNRGTVILDYDSGVFKEKLEKKHYININSGIRLSGKIEQDKTYKNIANFIFTVPPMANGVLLGERVNLDTTFFPNSTKTEYIIKDRVQVTDNNGNVISSDSYEITYNNGAPKLLIKKSLSNGIVWTLPYVLNQPKKLSTWLNSNYKYPGETVFTGVETITDIEGNINFSLNGSDLLYQTNDVTFQLVDFETKVSIKSGEFNIYNDQKKLVGAHTVNSQGKFTVPNMFVGESIYLVQTKASPDYDINPDYEGEGLQVPVVKEDNANNHELTNKRKAKETTVHLQQVVLNKNKNLVVPTTGFAYLNSVNNLNESSVTSTKSTVNVLATSQALDNEIYQTNRIQKVEGHPYINVELIIPEYFELAGSVVSEKKELHDETTKKTGAIMLDGEKVNEFWVTIYLVPSASGGTSPGLYGWDYGNNSPYTIIP